MAEGSGRDMMVHRNTPLPMFSVVTVVLNSRTGIEGTVLSVLAQSYRSFEYLVLDGGSTDGTLEIVRQYAEGIDCIVSEPDDGIYDAFNKGIARACGRYVLLLNSGDRLLPDALQKVARAAEGFSGRDHVICGAIDVVDEDYRPLRRVVRDSAGLRNRYRFMFLNHPATFVAKQTYSRLGGYDRRFRIAGDYEFAQRLLEHAVPIDFLPDVLTQMQAGGISTRFSWTHVAEYFSIIQTYAGTMRAAKEIARFFPAFAVRSAETAVKRSLRAIFVR
jgi:glycosyltransferase involved in cell wall biosynthesis